MHKNKLRLSIGFIFCFFIVSALLSCGSSSADAEYVVNGYADLSAVDFSEKSVELYGTWLLFPDEIVSPEDAERRLLLNEAVYVTVPGLWRSQEFRGKKGSAFGVGTMVLRLKLPAGCGPLVFRIPLSQGSSRIFINGQHAHGVLVTNPERPDLVPICNVQNLTLPVSEQDVCIVMQKANWWDSFGSGQMTSPSVGSAQTMEAVKGFNIGHEFFLAGCLLFCALYHLMLFVLSRRDKALLWFSLFSLSILLRQLSIGEKFIMEMAGLTHFTLVKIEVGSAYLVCILLMEYFSSVLPQFTHKNVRRMLVFLAFLGLSASFVPDPRFYSSLLWYLRLIIAGTSVFCLYSAVRSIIKKNDQAVPMLIGLCSLVFPSVFDILITTFSVKGRYLMPLGFIPFVFIESYLLSRRYSKGTREAEQLRIKSERLADLDRVKTAFIANVSHELRTPITLIKTPIEAVQKGTYGETIERTHPVFNIVISNTKRILKLVESFLMMTRLDSEVELDKVPLDTVSLVTRYIEDLKPSADEAGITVVCELPPEAHNGPIAAAVDMRAFDIVFFNLLSNALKYTPKGGTVTVSLNVKQSNPDNIICLSVTDTGVGISEEDLPKLFTRYQKIYDSVRTHYNSNGIGLSLAREAARAMGGDITVASTVGKGSCFTLTLPQCSADVECQTSQTSEYLELFGDPEDKKEPLNVSSVSNTLKLARILIVEDNQTMRHFVSEILSPQYCVTETYDGLNAKEFLDHQAPPDLIISDIMMPRMDGIELFYYTRSVEKLSNIPFIMLTARDESVDKVQLISEGAVDYITKPFAVDELLARIASVLKQRRAERDKIRQKIDRLLEHAFLEDDNEMYSPDSSALSGAVREPARPAVPDELSKRETEVFILLLQELSDKEIAASLGISVRTASNHVAGILHKTNTSARGELIAKYGKLL